MKPLGTVFIFWISVLHPRVTNAQVVCIRGFEQNDSVSSGVNNLLLNGSFEIRTCTTAIGSFCPNSGNYSCDLDNWTCTGGGLDTYARISDNSETVVPEGNKAVYFGNSSAYSCAPGSLDTSCLKDSLWIVTGVLSGFPVSGFNYGGTAGVSLEQSVSGLIPGATYILEFWAGGESGAGLMFSERGLFAVDVGFGNTFLRCKPTPAGTGTGHTYLIEFKATTPSHNIKFTNWGHICFTCTELMLDHVRLYMLAELPASVPPCSNPCNLPMPVINSNQTIFCDQDSVMACAHTGFTSYLWNTGESTECIKAGLGSTVYVTVTDSRNCPAIDSMKVSATDCGWIIPNAFTPNGDGKNDRFYPVMSSHVKVAEFRIYNRWGNLIYDNPVEGWNGDVDGKPQPPGTYVYYIIFEKGDSFSGEHSSDKESGSFTLIR